MARFTSLILYIWVAQKTRSPSFSSIVVWVAFLRSSLTLLTPEFPRSGPAFYRLRFSLDHPGMGH
mgnify:CR=1 FL=1